MSIRELFTNRVKMPPNDTKTEVTYPDKWIPAGREQNRDNFRHSEHLLKKFLSDQNV